METWQEQPRSANPADQNRSADPAGDELTSVRFAEAARQIGRTAVTLGLTAPAFRSPPKRPGVQRSITRRSDGSATVSVAIRGRPAAAVVADMIDGVLAANEPGSTRSPAVRDRLWSAATPCLLGQSGRSDGAGRARSRGPATGVERRRARSEQPDRRREASSGRGAAERRAA